MKTGFISRPSQADRIAAVFLERPGEWIHLPHLLDLKPRITDIAARIWELRHRRGMDIRNQTRKHGDEVHSSYMYVPKVPEPGMPASLFGNIEPQRSAFDVQGGR